MSFNPRQWEPVKAGELADVDKGRAVRVPMALSGREVLGELEDVRQWGDVTATLVREPGHFSGQWMALDPALVLLVERRP